MGGKPLNGCRILLIAPRTYAHRGWPKEKVEAWVKNAGGALQKDFDEQTTTHVVAEEPAWKNKVRHVKLALEANENGAKVYIVTPDWLSACLSEQKKYRERPYLWEKLKEEASGGKQKKRGAQRGDGEEQEENDEAPRKTLQAMLGEVLQEGTEEYIVDHDRREYEAKMAGIQKAEREREEAEARRKAEEKEVLEQQRKQRAAEMKKTAKRGRGEIFNQNYHPWKDSTDFVYDIMLTRVDTLTNRNERINLTIFESNDNAPHTYAVNLHFAGTDKQPMNNILAAIGSNWNTAMHKFRKAFEEKTQVNWDDRIKAHNERVQARNHDADTPGPGSTRFGENGSVKSKARAAEEKKPFDHRAFEYMPPTYGNKGWLPEGKETRPESFKQRSAKSSKQRDRTAQWAMSDENGMGPEAFSQSPHQSTEKTEHPTHIDLTEDEPADHVSVSSAADSDDDSDSDSNENGADGELAKTAEEAAAADDLLNGASTGAFDINSLFAGTHEWPVQDLTFDIGDSTQQQQQDFVFEEDFNVDPANEPSKTPATGLETDQHTGDDPAAKNTTPVAEDADLQTSLADDGEAVVGTLPDQTQLAAMVAEDLLGVGDAAGGLVMIPEDEQLEAASGVGKRKRGPDDVEETETAAKRFEGEEFAT